MSRRFAWWVSALAVVGVGGAAASCATLGPLEAGVCGNGVVDLNEDCDRLASTVQKQDAAAGKTACLTDGVHACHYGCTSAGDCPAGWGCDLGDGICARPSGEFAALPLEIESGAVRMVKGDFDGDGKTDLVVSQPSGIGATTSATALFFERGMVLREQRRIANPMGALYPLPAALADRALTVASDAGATSTSRARFPATDLGYASTYGVGVLHWEEGEPLVPQLFPFVALSSDKGGKAVKVSGLIPVPMPTVMGSGRGQMIYLGASDANEVDGTPKDPKAPTPPKTAIVRVSLSERSTLAPDQLVTRVSGAPSQVRFTTGPAGKTLCLKGGVSCGNVLVWSTEEPTVHLLDPVALVAKDITIATGLVPADAVAVGNVDANPEQDIVIGKFPDKTSGAIPCPVMVSGNGIRPGDLRPGDVPEGACDPIRRSPFVGLLDLNNDGISDFFYGSEIRVSVSPARPLDNPRFVSAYRRALSPWTEMAVGDFDGDGLQDAILGVSGESSLDLVLGSTGEIRVVTIPTPEPLDTMVAGHFDGDRLMDLAYSTKLVRAGKEASVYVLFGGPEQQSVRVGSKSLSQLVNLGRPFTTDSVGAYLPDLDFVGLVQDPDATKGEPGRRAGDTLLYGAYAPEGRAFASLVRAESADLSLRGRSVAFGDFLGQGKLDAVQVRLGLDPYKCADATIEPNSDLFAPPVGGTPSLATVKYAPLGPIALVAGTENGEASVFSVGCPSAKGPQGQETIVKLSFGKATAGSVLSGKGNEAFREVFSIDYTPEPLAADRRPAVSSCSADPRNDALSPSEKLELLDLDDDGRSELVFSDGGRLRLKGDPSASLPLWPGVLVVLRKDGDRLSEVRTADGSPLRGRSFSKLRLPGNRSGLAVLGSSEVSVYTLAAGVLTREKALSIPAPGDEARAIEAGDFNGDGIEDLAILGGGKLLVYSGKVQRSSDAGAAQ